MRSTYKGDDRVKAIYDIVGKTFKNKKGLEFIVIEQSGRSNNYIAQFTVKFIKSGYIAYNITSGHIRKGEVKDYLSPSVFDVGCLGYAWGYAKRNESRRLYYTWRNMIRRCYDPTYSKYKWYGAKGITVCERWHRLDYFIEDIVNLPGYDPKKFENNMIEMDKDIIDRGRSEYSPETCSLVTHAENNREALNRRWHPDIA